VTDIQISKVILSKEISWESVKKRDLLFTDMMRNRVTLHAYRSLGAVTYRNSHPLNDLWADFCKDTRKYLDAKNVGLYSFVTEACYTLGNSVCNTGANGVVLGESDGAQGHITIYFEDAGDYARFLKERAVNFKLSIY
jgi:hypothetical protein